MKPAEVRATLAQTIQTAMHADGWIVPPSTALVVADALITRPGLLRDVLSARIGAPRDPARWPNQQPDPAA